MQKYRSDFTRTQSDGATLHYVNWIGGPTLAKITNCRLESLAGNMRATVYITGEADTYFSIPALCRIKNCRVKGYITNSDDDIRLVVFRHVYYNEGLNPMGPREILAMMLEAIIEGDELAAGYALDDLMRWQAIDGFMPEAEIRQAIAIFRKR